MKWQRCVFSFFIVVYISVCCHGRTLTEILSRYEALNKVDFRHTVFRRSLTDVHNRDISFVSHGKNFHLKLVQTREIYDSSFRVVSIDRYGEETPVHINMDSLYKGYVENDPTSHVTAHLDEDGLITATINTANDTYVVEPMRRHVDKDPSHDVIVYKASDLKWNLTNPNDGKGGVHAKCGNNDTFIEDDDNDDVGERVRRNTGCSKVGGKNTCKLHLIADYNYCRYVGRLNKQATALSMVLVVDYVNTIYRKTCWNGIGTDIGVQVKKVSLYCDGYSSSGYNAKGRWNVDSLLTEFSRSDKELNGYCLAHLFTYQDFNGGVIGLAYVGSSRSRYGGICSPETRDRRGKRKHNCGFTSHVNWGRRLTTLEANLVTAHEIGHNFGSKHDPEGTCAPSDGGKFIMYASSVTGRKTNNNVFSKCSKSQIGGVLQKRKSWSTCLEVKGGSMCKNGIVEGDEECDEGNENKCCTDDCKGFRTGATCSDANSLCCTDCKTAPANSKVCRGNFTAGCEAATKCDGTSEKCPTDPPKLTSGNCNLPSLHKGTCAKNGSCVSICGENSSPCPCAAGIDACKACCMRIGGCLPHTSGVKEGDGVDCTHAQGGTAVCDEGVCTSLQRDVKSSFKNLLTDFSLDKAVQWMENNIVITILFFSLLIWIPAGIIVTLIDKHEENKYKELVEESENFSRQSKQRGSFKKEKNVRARASRGGET